MLMVILVINVMLVVLLVKPEWSEGDADTTKEDEEDQGEHKSNVATEHCCWKYVDNDDDDLTITITMMMVTQSSPVKSSHDVS